MDQKEALRKVVLSFRDQALALKITDEKSMRMATGGAIRIRKEVNRVKDYFDPKWREAKDNYKTAKDHASKLQKTMQSIKDEWNSFLRPLEEGEGNLKEKLATYLQEQKDKEAARIRKEEADKKKAEAEAKRKEEDKLQAALKAEEAGRPEEAEKIMSEEIIPEAQLETPPPAVTPKLDGLTEKIEYGYEIYDETMVSPEYKMPNKEALDQAIFPLLKKINIPGVEAVEISWKWKIPDITKVPATYLQIDHSKIEKIVKVMKNDTKIPGIRIVERTKVQFSRGGKK